MKAIINHKSLFWFIFFILFKSNLIAQVVLNENFIKSIQQNQDTSANLHFFNKLDIKFQQKIDSFYQFITETKITNKKGITDKNADSGYIVVNIYLPPHRKYLQLDFRLSNTFIYYLITTDKKDNYERLFGFTLYKQKVVLFNLDYTKYKIKDEFLPLVKDLIIPQLTKNVQNEIAQNSDDIEIYANGIIKRFRIPLK
jgi:hypothetical protein